MVAGNKAYFAAISLFKSRLLYTATKILLYKTLIRKVVTYATEVWTMTRKEEEALLIFERKILRGIYTYCPKYENGEWKSRTNPELEEITKGENIVKWIKGQRIGWLGHLERMGRGKDGVARSSRENGKRKGWGG